MHSYHSIISNNTPVLLSLVESDDETAELSSGEEAAAEEVCDMEFLHRLIADAGRWAFGIIFAELWVLDDTGTQLFRPDCGWWMDHYACSTHAFSKLVDSSLPDYIPAEPCMPGIGLPGYLWAQATNKAGNTRQSVMSGRQSLFRKSSDGIRTSLLGAGGGGKMSSAATRSSMYGTISNLHSSNGQHQQNH
ncbi:unnamed protein product, partial [Cylindrotheca closterium]